MTREKAEQIARWLEFDEDCGMCGNVTESASKVCKYCNGTGVKLTPFGEQLLLFLERQGIVPTEEDKCGVDE